MFVQMWIDLVPTWLTTCSLFCRSSDHVFEAKQLSQSQASLEQDAPQTCWVTLMWAGMELGTLQVRSEHDQSIGFPLAFWRGDRTRKMTRHWERRNNEWENGWDNDKHVSSCFHKPQENQKSMGYSLELLYIWGPLWWSNGTDRQAS